MTRSTSALIPLLWEPEISFQILLCIFVNPRIIVDNTVKWYHCTIHKRYYDFNISCHKAYLDKCLMTLITFRKTAESTMRSDSISATGSRCSPRDLTPTDRHSSRSHHLHLHATLLSTKLLPWLHYVLNMPPTGKDLIATCGFKGRLYGSFA